MIVNSRRGPLNCSEYDSAFDATDANTPAAGIAPGLIHASTDAAFAGASGGDDGIPTHWPEPENDAALSVSPVSKPGTPFVTPPLYTPGSAPALSIADVPDVSPNLQ